MTEYAAEIMVAVFAFAGTAFSSIMINGKNSAVMKEQITAIKDDIKTLSDRVNKHNNLVERMAIVEEREKSNTHRIDSLEVQK